MKSIPVLIMTLFLAIGCAHQPFELESNIKNLVDGKKSACPGLKPNSHTKDWAAYCLGHIFIQHTGQTPPPIDDFGLKDIKDGDPRNPYIWTAIVTNIVPATSLNKFGSNKSLTHDDWSLYVANLESAIEDWEDSRPSFR